MEFFLSWVCLRAHIYWFVSGGSQLALARHVSCPGLAVSRMIVWRDHVKRHDKVVISLKTNQGRPSKRKGSPPVPAVANSDADFFCVSIYLHAYDRDKMGGNFISE